MAKQLDISPIPFSRVAPMTSIPHIVYKYGFGQGAPLFGKMASPIFGFLWNGW